MREALARSDNDFLVAEPRRRKKPAPRPGWLSALIGVARFLRGAANYPNRIAGALLVGLAVAIAVNALELQTARHPAPFFGRTATLSPALPAETAPTPAPAPAPADMPRVAAPAPSATPVPTAPVTAAPPAPTDPLGQFIRQGEATPAHRSTAPLPAARPDAISQILRRATETTAAPQQPSRTVFAVQRALVKLGFVLKADGIEGDATRKAIIQFESDHHLPPRGDLSARLVRALRAESDIAIP